MSRKVPNQSFEVFIFAIGRGKKKILENKNKSQNRRGRKKRLQILRWMQRKNELHELGETLRHKGLFPGARLLISKSTGLDDPCWSKGVHEDASQRQCLNSGILAGGPMVTLCASSCLALSSLWITYRETATVGSPRFSWNVNITKQTAAEAPGAA